MSLFQFFVTRFLVTYVLDMKGEYYYIHLGISMNVEYISLRCYLYDANW